MEQADIQTRKLLVVDDDETVLKLFLALRRKYNGLLEVIVLQSVDGAIKEMERGCSPDLILADVSLPKKSGIELVEWIYEFRKDLFERLYLMSGYDRGAISLNPLLTQYPNHFIQKPSILKPVTRIIEQHLGLRKRQEPSHL